MQMMVGGEVAAALGALCRRRWHRATGNEVEPARDTRKSMVWPTTIDREFLDIKVAISRTELAYDGNDEVREVKSLYLDSIAKAERAVYFENQYFTAPAIAQAIAGRLADPRGPEFVIVSRCVGSSWLENNTMTVLRARMIRELKAADRHGRLRFYYPEQAGLEGENCIALHSKLAIVDDRFLRVGSANLNNRSMGLDTECDLAFEAEREDDRKTIASIRNRLLAEHLGVEPSVFAEALENRQSLIGAIEALVGNDRTLLPIPDNIDPDLDKLVPDTETIDPERPIDPDRLIDDIMPHETRPEAGGHAVGVAMLILAVASVAVAWRWGPLGEWLDLSTLESIGVAIQQLPAAPLWVLGAYVLASFLVMPITLLVLATAFSFRRMGRLCLRPDGFGAWRRSDVCVGQGSGTRHYPAYSRHTPERAEPAAGGGRCGRRDASTDASGGTVYRGQYRRRCDASAHAGLPDRHCARHGARHTRGDRICRPAGSDRARSVAVSSRNSGRHDPRHRRRRIGYTPLGEPARTAIRQEFRLTASANMTISVATYNVHRCIGRDSRYDPMRILAVLRELDADFIALQELQWRNEDALHVLADFAARLGYASVAGPTLFKPDGHYGNAVLTRLEVAKIERIDLSVAQREPRGALDIELAVPQGVLRVISTHLGLSPGERREQMTRLLGLLGRKGPPVVLMGDFNEWFLWGRPIAWLRAHFGSTPAPATFPARYPVFALDRIWVEPRKIMAGIAVHRSTRARAASDHLPLRATLSWPDQLNA